MERIKLAIERARQQAAAAQGSAATLPRVTPLRGPAHPLGPILPLDRGAAVDLFPLDEAHLERNRIVTLQQDNPLRGCFDLLRTQVLQKMQEHGWRTIAVTSPSMQSGKTVVSINLALSIAHHPSKAALLVDFDLRRPQVATYLGLPARESLNEVFGGKTEVHKAIVHAGIPGFLVLPTRSKVTGAAEILASDNVARMIGALRDEHPDRVVVIDLPPVTAVDDVIAVLPRVDCVLLVVGNGDSTKREMEETKRHLARFPLLGVVVNKVPDQALAGRYY
jgi:capsular exopolysaccharide synthesis family protein